MCDISDDMLDWSDEEVVEELGRAGWYRTAPGASRMEKEISLTQEALRRILKRLIAEDNYGDSKRADQRIAEDAECA